MPDPQLESSFDKAINGMKVGPFRTTSGLKGESGTGIGLP
jgi:hypothetical protein